MTDVFFAVYEKTDGRIEYAGTVSGDEEFRAFQIAAQMFGRDPDVYGLVEHTAELSPATHYVDILADPPAAAPRLEMTVTTDKATIDADGTDTATITGIPVGALVTLEASNDFAEASETVSTGSTTVTTVHKVPHVLRIELYPYKTETITITGV